jgi:phosphotransferase system  glucose/maltose/N-acetylglucosamine-specific IIC component
MPSFSNAFSYLQKIGKCMMLPVSVLPVAGILLGVGSANFSWLPQIVSQAPSPVHAPAQAGIQPKAEIRGQLAVKPPE